MKILNIDGSYRSSYSIKLAGNYVAHLDWRNEHRYQDDISFRFDVLKNKSQFRNSPLAKVKIIKKMILADEYDAVITSRKDDMVFAFLASMFLKKKPLLLTISRNSYSWSSKYKVFIYSMIARLVTDGFLSLGSFVSRHLISFGYDNDRIGLISNPIFSRENFKTDYKLTDYGPQIAYTAVVNYMKGQHVIVNAIAILKNTYPNIKLNLIGDFVDTNYYKQLVSFIEENKIQNNVTLHGRIDNQLVMEMLPLQDIYVCPSLMEMCPNNILEAETFGLPIIASNVGGIPDIVDDNSAILIPPNDVDSLVNKIEFLLENQMDRESLGRNAHKRAANFYNMEKVGQVTIDFISKLNKKNDIL